MGDVIESGNYNLPIQAKNDIANRVKKGENFSAIEMNLKGEEIESASDFSRMLLGLKRQGVRVSHDFSIKLDFPKGVNRDQALAMVECMPRPKNGHLKVKLFLADQGRRA